MQKAVTEHDKYVAELVRYLDSSFDQIFTHQELAEGGDVLCEIDILAKRGSEIHLYEVKCSNRMNKAKEQLKKAERFYEGRETFCYFYNGEGDFLVELDT